MLRGTGVPSVDSVQTVSRCKRAHARRRRSNERGAAVVEMAVAVPMLLLIVTGICTFGIAFNNYVMMTEAASVGARYLSIERDNTSDPCNTAGTAFINAAPLLNSSNVSFTLVITPPPNSGGSTYTSPTGKGSSWTCTGGAADLVQGATAQLTVTYPCNLAVYGTNYAPTCNLETQIAEIVQ